MFRTHIRGVCIQCEKRLVARTLGCQSLWRVILFKGRSMSKIVGEHNFNMLYIIVCSGFLLNLQNDNKKNVILSGFHQPLPAFS